MKLKNLFAVALAATVLASCTKEVIKEVPVGGGEETGTSLVKFTMDANMVKTKASPHGDLTPTADELKIYNYALFIFKSNGMLEKTLVSSTTQASLSNPLNLNPANKLEFIHDVSTNPVTNPDLDDDGVLTISSGAKTIFAVVNVPYEYIGSQTSFVNNEALTLSELREQVLTLTDNNLNKIVGSYGTSTSPVYFENDMAASGNRGFMMTNIAPDGSSYQRNDGFYRITLEETTATNPDPVNITVLVGRAMSKVSLASELKTKDDASLPDDNHPYGTLEVQGYKIINNPNKMNIAMDLTNGTLKTPYFYTYSSTTPIATNNYFISNNTSDGTDYIKPSTISEQTFTYCIENANHEPRHGNATIALIKGKYIPLTGTKGKAKIYEDLTNSNELSDLSSSPNGDFYRVWIKPYDDPQNPGAKLGGRYIEDAYYVKDPAEFFSDQDAIAEHPEIAHFESVYYPKGIAFYRLALYNEKNQASPYTVQRNSYYKIDIQAVTGPGYPADPDDEEEPDTETPDYPDPETPLEPQTDIQANIQVLNWDEVNQIGKL